MSSRRTGGAKRARAAPAPAAGAGSGSEGEAWVPEEEEWGVEIQPQPKVARKGGAGGKAKRGRKASKAPGSGKAPSARKVTPEEALAPIAALQSSMHTATAHGASDATLQSLGYSGVREVAETGPVAVQRRIEHIVAEVARSILEGHGFAYAVPNRGASNQMYIAELDRIVLRDKLSVRPFVGTSTVRKTAIMTRVMQLVHEVLSKNIHTTKRDLFYTDVKLFKSQEESNAVLDDVACMAGCTRTSLHVVASEKGVVVGRLQFREDGDFIDCSRMGVGGKAIPPFIDKITELTSDAKFVLLVEKDAAFMRLAEDRFYNKYPCVIITAKGQPDVATRLFLRKVKMTLGIPVLGLVDADPYGLKILSVYMSGSKAMSYDSASLTTPDIKWLGVRPSDLDKYAIPEQCRLPMTEKDIKTGKDLLKEDFIASNPAWHAELQTMVTSKVKAEIQSLSSYGFQYLTEVYLPQKLADGDWI